MDEQFQDCQPAKDLDNAPLRFQLRDYRDRAMVVASSGISENAARRCYPVLVLPSV